MTSKYPKEEKGKYKRTLLNPDANNQIKIKCVQIGIPMIQFFDKVGMLSLEQFKNIINNKKI